MLKETGYTLAYGAGPLLAYAVIPLQAVDEIHSLFGCQEHGFPKNSVSALGVQGFPAEIIVCVQ